MEYYRFSLEKYHPGSKTVCPSCGDRKSFTRYIDREGKIDFPDYVGRCDHINHCGHHVTPSDYFKERPEARPAESTPTPQPRQPQPKPVSYIEGSVMQSSLKCYDINPLFTYLERVFGKDKTARLFAVLRVGTSRKWGGSAIYWQEDITGNVRTGKIMCYNPKTGHRIKKPTPQVGWAHSTMGLKDFNLCQCYFGEHQLSVRPLDKVIIVESEKTAIIGTGFLPQYIWLATGGICNLKPSAALTGRDVTLIPDLGAETEWTAKLPALKEVCRSAEISDIISANATADQINAGWDIADFLLKSETAEMVMARLMETYPDLKEFINRLELKVVGFDEEE